MRIVAVYSANSGGRWNWLQRRRPQAVVWHAVAERTPPPTLTICGGPITSEAFRTWEQAPFDARCPECEQAVTAAQASAGAKSAEPINKPHRGEVAGLSDRGHRITDTG